jgi:hypothetical protein
MSVETVVEKAVEDVKSVAEEVVTEAKKVEGEVVTKVKEALIQIAAEEKLVLREAELEYLKAQMEIQRLSKITEAKSKEYQAYIEGLFMQYGLAKTEYMFDAAVNQFKKL